MKKNLIHIIIVLSCVQLQCATAQQSSNATTTVKRTKVLVVGGGTGGTAAGIQSARLGVATIIVEPTNWLGGMISAAGVTATDGNHKLASGLWNEFRNQIYKVYGGPSAVETGWVSNTHFEPHIADSIFKKMASLEPSLIVLHGWQFEKTMIQGNKIVGANFTNAQNKKLQIIAEVVIDATEMGDVMASAKVPYDLGMEAEAITGEKVGIKNSNDIVQDLTYVAILKDYGPAKDCTIVKPARYTPAEFDGACTDYYIDKTIEAPNVDAKKMLDYARLPNKKYMLNWPKNGNDTYLNVVELSPKERALALEEAKQTTLRFTYFIQHQLGFKNLGLADDEFPTSDRLAVMPYYREGRRVKGLVRFTINDIATPFNGDPLYRTGISVGDYPIDHHHRKNKAAPQHLDFFPVPSYNIPLGALIPETIDGLIMAEKGISVSNVVNGTTRLQPVVMLTGQAAGALAALSVKEKSQPRNVSVRRVQDVLLQAKASIMPYMDVNPTHPQFSAIQKIGATGILKGTGIPYKWANQTWFYPDSTITLKSFMQSVNDYKIIDMVANDAPTSLQDLFSVVRKLIPKQTDNINFQNEWQQLGLTNFNVNRAAKRFEIAAILNELVDPFGTRQINHKGTFLNNPIMNTK